MTFTMLYRLLVNTCGSLLGYRLVVNWDYTFFNFVKLYSTNLYHCLLNVYRLCARICLVFHNILIPYVEASFLPRSTVTLASEDLE